MMKLKLICLSLSLLMLSGCLTKRVYVDRPITPPAYLLQIPDELEEVRLDITDDVVVSYLQLTDYNYDLRDRLVSLVDWILKHQSLKFGEK